MNFGPKKLSVKEKGKNGMLKTSCKGKDGVDLTTSSPTLMKKFSKKNLKNAGGYTVDAPVTGFSKKQYAEI